jgi:hypothetical protein
MPSPPPPQVHEQEAQGELLATQKLLLLAATASQDVELLYHVMHALASKAQELHCLQVGGAQGWGGEGEAGLDGHGVEWQQGRLLMPGGAVYVGVTAL